MRCALPDRAQSGLHAKPLNIAIGRLFAQYCPGVSAIVIDGDDTQNKTFSLTVHHEYTKLVKKDMKGTLYSSHLKCKFVEIAIDSKKAKTISNFYSYRMLKLDKNSWRNSSPKKLKK